MKINVPILLIINKSDKYSEFSPEQENPTIHRAQYLRLIYMNILKMIAEDRYLLKKCCKEAIEDLKKNRNQVHPLT